jgi:hypothetical protein
MEAKKDCAHCSPSKSDQKNTVPGARLWETPAQTEERKRIACLMRNRPKAMSHVEKRVVVMLYGIDDDTKRMSCAAVARSLELKCASEVHAIAATALKKIFYRPPGSRRSSA